MDFSLGDDRRMLVDSLSRYLADKFDFDARMAAIETEAGFSREVWTGLAELGAIGALFGEDLGGYGGTAFDIGAVFGELGRALATGPFLGTLMAGKVLEAAGEADALADIIAGETLITFAHDPAVGGDGAPAPAAAAKKRDGEAWALTGAKGVVDYAAAVDRILVTAETDEGLSTFLLDRTADGVEIRDYPLIDGGSAGELVLTDAPAQLIGEAGAAGPVIDAALAAGLVATAWEAVAVMEVVRDATLEYLGTRKQFGMPIGNFQALRHRMTTVALEIEQARSAAINAAANLDRDAAARDRYASAAKHTIGVAGALTAEEAIQMHGGIGMTWELPLSHYAKRLTMLDHVLGDADEHLSRYMALRAA
ncbi:pimeloyl-CoA dehydrogenase small subunit [Marinicauda salina]|uniref:Pimeloyl-CoA dehydrogenase small subunit n=1 Tax=Marinicauda salina TaxID=2135793 RepID=A0A2U2BR07_9PROT|nr:acyl-CoA dehydrogenase family protein [Marinicauda salina]PWE16429.1 pimeloyl-CoA dehydrogenase small subunit [Marinicauda salina]